MSAFLNDNWLALISLAVALTGGVPGIIEVINHRRRRISFGTDMSALISGNLESDEGVELTVFTLLITITNSGEQPLVPSIFDCELQFQGEWIRLERFLIPASVELGSEFQEIALDRFMERDLQRLTGSILPETPAHGSLMFTTASIPLPAFQSCSDAKLRLTCTDVFGKPHRAIIEIPKSTITRPTEYPKLGARVRPKRPT